LGQGVDVVSPDRFAVSRATEKDGEGEVIQSGLPAAPVKIHPSGHSSVFPEDVSGLDISVNESLRQGTINLAGKFSGGLFKPVSVPGKDVGTIGRFRFDSIGLISEDLRVGFRSWAEFLDSEREILPRQMEIS